jgi:hypothetical protein
VVSLERHIAQGEAGQIVYRGVVVAPLEDVFALAGVGETEPEIQILNCPVAGNFKAAILSTRIDAGEVDDPGQGGSRIDSAIKGQA